MDVRRSTCMCCRAPTADKGDLRSLWYILTLFCGQEVLQLLSVSVACCVRGLFHAFASQRGHCCVSKQCEGELLNICTRYCLMDLELSLSRPSADPIQEPTIHPSHVKARTRTTEPSQHTTAPSVLRAERIHPCTVFYCANATLSLADVLRHTRTKSWPNVCTPQDPTCTRTTTTSLRWR